jgi:hypothetical protein
MMKIEETCKEEAKKEAESKFPERDDSATQD